MYVRNAAAGAYDCIILDAFSIGGRIPFHLVTKEFVALCREKLGPGGVFLMNINSSLEGPKSQIFQSMYKTIEAVFPENAHVFALGRGTASPRESTNVILIGANRDKSITPEDWTAWAQRYESISYVNQSAVVQMIDDLVVALPDINTAPVFTDDYAPIETMPF
jgi:spermidine synthase